MGTPGESREVLLELMLLADVGILGMLGTLESLGKSYLIRAVSAAKTKSGRLSINTLVP